MMVRKMFRLYLLHFNGEMMDVTVSFSLKKECTVDAVENGTLHDFFCLFPRKIIFFTKKRRFV